MIGWFEISVSDIFRAKTFYETVFKIDINVMDFGGTLMGWFPNQKEGKGTTGALIQNAAYVPSENGTLVYFISDNVQNELDKIKAAGGKIYQKKTKISEEHGFMGVFIDTEGNRLALLSTN